MLVVFSDNAEPLSRLLGTVGVSPTCSPTWLGKNMQWGTSSSQRHLAPLWIEVFFFFFSLRASLLSHSGKFVLAARRGKASPQAKGEKLGYGKKRKSFLEFASRHGNHLYPDSPRRPPSRTARGAVDQLTGFLKRSIRRAHAALGNDQIGHPSVSTLGCLLKSPHNHLIGRAVHQFSPHDSWFASDCGIFFFMFNFAHHTEYAESIATKARCSV